MQEKKHSAVMRLIHKAMTKCQLSGIIKMACARWWASHFNTSWIKVTRTLVSPELVWTSFNVALSLCYGLWNVTSLSLSRISSFKRSWEFLTGVSTCLITPSWNKVSEDKPNGFFTITAPIHVTCVDDALYKKLMLTLTAYTLKWEQFQ
jgi:hypothetical protein